MAQADAEFTTADAEATTEEDTGHEEKFNMALVATFGQGGARPGEKKNGHDGTNEPLGLGRPKNEDDQGLVFPIQASAEMSKGPVFLHRDGQRKWIECFQKADSHRWKFKGSLGSSIPNLKELRCSRRLPDGPSQNPGVRNYRTGLFCHAHFHLQSVFAYHHNSLQ